MTTRCLSRNGPNSIGVKSALVMWSRFSKKLRRRTGAAPMSIRIGIDKSLRQTTSDPLAEAIWGYWAIGG